MSCPEDGNFDSCEIIKNGNSSYIRIISKSSKTKNIVTHAPPITEPMGTSSITKHENIDNAKLSVNSNKVQNSKPYKVGASRKTAAGSLLTLISYLKLLQTRNIEYVYVNQYLRSEFKALGDTNPMGIGYIAEMLTYDPRLDTPKDYPDILAILKTAPSSLDWNQIWDIIDGLKTF